MSYQYTSRDGLLRSNDADAIARWNQSLDHQESDRIRWTEALRAMGVKLAHPNDGWVKRDEDGHPVSFSMSWYPLFDDRPEVGDLVAFGAHYDATPERPYVICRVTEAKRTRTILAHGLNEDFKVEDTGQRVPPPVAKRRWWRR